MFRRNSVREMFFQTISFSEIVFPNYVLFRNVSSRLILFRNCLFRLHPFQGMSVESGSFSGTVFSDLILFRNCLFRLDPFQEPSCQTWSFPGTVFSGPILVRKWSCSGRVLFEFHLLSNSRLGHADMSMLTGKENGSLFTYVKDAKKSAGNGR